MVTSKHTTTQIQSITYTLQREGGSLHRVQSDPRDGVLRCSCPAGVYGRTCWAIRLVEQGQAGKPRVRVTVRRPRPVISEETRTFVSMLDV